MFEREKQDRKRCKIVVIIDLYHGYFGAKFTVSLKYTSLLKTFVILWDSVCLIYFIVVMLLGKL